MANFADILAKISTAAQAVTAAEPAVETFSTDHVAGTQQLLNITGATVAAESVDAGVQSEAVASAQLASSLVPTIFNLLALFHHKKKAA